MAVSILMNMISDSQMRSRMSCSIRWAFNFGAWNPSEEEWTKAVSCVQIEELKRIDGFVFKKDAKASMIGRLLMRKMAVEKLGLRNDGVRFARNDHEKPFLTNEVDPSIASALSFNVSHQGSFCVFAFEPDRPIGVDVMKIEYSGGKPLSEFFRLMRRQFTTKEWITISAPSSESDQLFLFCRHWCLKESYVKALGVGVGFDLQRVGFRIETKDLRRDTVTMDTVLEVDGISATNWTFQETMIDDEHCVAVAVRSVNDVRSTSNEIPRFKLISFDELVRSLVPLRPLDSSRWPKFNEKHERPP